MTQAALPRLRRIRWGVRAVLVLGVAASVVANILHARTNPISQTIAAWPPLALLLTVELISRVPVHRRSLAAVRFVATTAIAGIAAWVSYWHMVGVASRYGETDASPYLMPVSVDGLVVVASVCLVELAGRIRALEADPSPTPPAADPNGVNTQVDGEMTPLDPTADPVDMPPDPWATYSTERDVDEGGDQTAGLRDQTDQDSDQTGIRPRLDADLIAEFRDQILGGPLTRYRVEQITGASRRQAERILNALTDQTTDQTDLTPAK